MKIMWGLICAKVHKPSMIIGEGCTSRCFGGGSCQSVLVKFMHFLTRPTPYNESHLVRRMAARAFARSWCSRLGFKQPYRTINLGICRYIAPRVPHGESCAREHKFHRTCTSCFTINVSHESGKFKQPETVLLEAREQTAPVTRSLLLEHYRMARYHQASKLESKLGLKRRVTYLIQCLVCACSRVFFPM